MQIDFQQYPTVEGAKFSILIPSWNNLPYLKLCVESLRKNSAFSHQIILHINDGSDGSLAWAREQKIDHSFSRDNVGVCHALNAAATLATTDYIAFINDDMYVLPHWDRPFVQEIEAIAQRRFFLSGTMIEPTDTGNRCVIAPHDFGRNVEDFREEDLLETGPKLAMDDWAGSTWPPNLVPRALWEEVGGYSEEFSPGMSSDPDFSMKLWQVGVRYFKGLGESRVYHFQAKSTGKVVKNPGPQQFLNKWGITQGTFSKYYLRRGRPWHGPLPPPGPFLPYNLARFKSRIKAAFQK
jgi:glycosyltransferase involved in cell wall biosynthesis